MRSERIIFYVEQLAEIDKSLEKCEFSTALYISSFCLNCTSHLWIYNVISFDNERAVQNTKATYPYSRLKCLLLSLKPWKPGQPCDRYDRCNRWKKVHAAITWNHSPAIWRMTRTSCVRRRSPRSSLTFSAITWKPSIATIAELFFFRIAAIIKRSQQSYMETSLSNARYQPYAKVSPFQLRIQRFSPTFWYLL